MINENRNINLNELENHFDYIYKMIDSEINVYDSDLSFYVLTLIFLKRIHDIRVDEIKFEKYNVNWKGIRNIAAHTHYKYEDELKYELYTTFKQFDIEYDNLNGIFKEVNFKHFHNITSLIPIILYLDRIDMSMESISIENMGVAYEKLIKKFFSRRKDDYITNDDITRLTVEILDVKLGESVYDPFMGIGSFYTRIVHYLRRASEMHIDSYKMLQRWSGQEIRSEIFSLCRMNLIMNGIDDIEIYLGDTILEPQNISMSEMKKFDKVISEIPVATRNHSHYETIIRNEFNRFTYGVPSQNTLQYGFIQHIIASLNEEGKAVIVLPMKSLYSKGSEKKIRKAIVEDDIIESIISLPRETYKNSRCEMAIVVVNKNKPFYRVGKIMFIDTTVKIKKFDENYIKKAVDVYKDYIEIEGYSTIVDLNEIREKKYDLNYKKYSPIFKENKIMLKGGKSGRIKDVVYSHPIMGIHANKFHTIEVNYIKTKNLNKDITEQFFDINNLETKIIDKPYDIIDSKAIIVALIGDNLKPTIINNECLELLDVVLDKNVIALVPKEDVIDFEYLYYQLYSPRVIQQLEALKTGIIPRITKSELLDIVISVPSIDLQKEYVKEQKLLLIQNEKMRYEESIKALKIEDSVADAEETVISILAHNTLPYISRMQFDINVIKRFLTEKELMEHLCDRYQTVEVLDDFGDIALEMQENHNAEKVEEVIQRIEKVITTFESIISETKKTVQLNLNDGDFESVNLISIFREIREEKAKDYTGKYEIEVDCPDISIIAHKPSIKELIMQLLRNAEMHAFSFQNRKKKNKVEFKVIEKQDKVIIYYSNNGKAFNITKEQYIKMGKKSQKSEGHGLGGAYINKVIKAHRGEFKIIKTNIGMKLEITLNKEGDN
ncbi:MAG: N-6 DNA methylase [Anaeromicrobium sp.]|jgi:type I restriction-modification system DNA methylase subunit|uniref:N-6 DNA methylase n=1 Tax=Anaeromicrobium sp. TaxID=1929132 RepID=UPI0025DAF48B|nr:N-6 DNA methylase [Anaeromicrobium sp.]MCT4592813.1 N-6 DNA methylase [Anaeromicrobium sp.]